MAEREYYQGRPVLPDEIGGPAGLLTDKEIRTALENEYLLRKDTIDVERIRYTSYELRLSNRVRFLRLKEGGGAEYVEPADGVQDTLTINPGETVLFLVMEEFDLPANVAATSRPVGNLYKVGLLPEPTYADPGFSGPFWMIICNYSPRVVTLGVGQPVARLEFIKLNHLPDRVHQGAGQVREPAHWPKRVDRREKEKLAEVGVDALLDELDQHDPPHWEHAFVTRHVRSTHDERYEDLREMLEGLTRQQAWLRLSVYILFAVALFFIWMKVKVLLPESLQDALTDWAVGGTISLLTLVIAALSKDIRHIVRTILTKKET